MCMKQTYHVLNLHRAEKANTLFILKMQDVCYVTAHDLYLLHKEQKDLEAEHKRLEAQAASDEMEFSASSRLLTEEAASFEAVQQLYKIFDSKQHALNQAMDQKDLNASITLTHEVSASFEALQQMMKMMDSRRPALEHVLERAQINVHRKQSGD